jgi:delta 1-pyrroline-5-carboxylate dehydrogenase
MPALHKPARRTRQLTLFTPSRPEPNWEAIPPETRQQIERLLARMLREHVAHLLGAAAVEYGDE